MLDRLPESTSLGTLFERLLDKMGVRVFPDRLIGSGTFAWVYEGEFNNGGRRCAVKVLRQPVDPDSRTFQAESKAAQNWLGVLGSLPNSLTLLGGPEVVPDGNSEARFVTVWELADGTLHECQKTHHPGGMPREVAFPFLRDVAMGLDDFFERDLQHRDIKPANLFRVGNRAKIGDPATMRPVSATATMTVGHHGTYEFMPPEAIDEIISNTFDRYSFAVTYAALRLGRLVFSDGVAAVSPKKYAEAMEHRKRELRVNLHGLDADEREFFLLLVHPDPQRRPLEDRLVDLFHALGPRAKKVFRSPEPATVKPSEVRIVEYRVEMNEIDVRAADVAAPPVGHDPFALPPIADEVLGALGRYKGLEQAIQQLQADTHPDLKPAQEKVDAAKQQHLRLKDDLARRRMKFRWANRGIAKEITRRIEHDPKCNLAELCNRMPNVNHDALLQHILRVRNVELARRELEKTEEQYHACVEARVDELREQLECQRYTLEKCLRQDFETCLQAFLKNLQQPEHFPIQEWLQLRPLLIARHYPWSELELLKMAEEVHRRGVLTIPSPDLLKGWFTQKQLRVVRHNWTVHLGITAEFTVLDNMRFVLIPPGECSPAGYHFKRITRPFYLQTTPTTIGQVLRWLNESGKWQDEWIPYQRDDCPIERLGASWALKKGTSRFGQSANQPMICISWQGAEAFTTWLTGTMGGDLGLEFRLPWEVQWAYAATAGSRGKWCFGDYDEGMVGRPGKTALKDYAWYDQNSGGCTHPVGKKKPNSFGLFDVHGNCAEWCLDWYDETFYDYNNSPRDDPFNGTPTDKRVFRPGSWHDTVDNCTLATRSGGASRSYNSSLGFRVAAVLSS